MRRAVCRGVCRRCTPSVRLDRTPAVCREILTGTTLGFQPQPDGPGRAGGDPIPYRDKKTGRWVKNKEAEKLIKTGKDIGVFTDEEGEKIVRRIKEKATEELEDTELSHKEAEEEEAVEDEENDLATVTFTEAVTEEQIQAIRELRRKGTSIRKIADALGVTHYAAQKYSKGVASTYHSNSKVIEKKTSMRTDHMRWYTAQYNEKQIEVGRAVMTWCQVHGYSKDTVADLCEMVLGGLDFCDTHKGRIIEMEEENRRLKRAIKKNLPNYLAERRRLRKSEMAQALLFRSLIRDVPIDEGTLDILKKM